MSNFTCKGCGNRKPGCHSHCEKYLAEKAAWDQQKAAHRKEAEIRMGLDCQKYGGITRSAKRKGRSSPSKFGGQ